MGVKTMAKYRISTLEFGYMYKVPADNFLYTLASRAYSCKHDMYVRPYRSKNRPKAVF